MTIALIPVRANELKKGDYVEVGYHTVRITKEPIVLGDLVDIRYTYHDYVVRNFFIKFISNKRILAPVNNIFTVLKH